VRAEPSLDVGALLLGVLCILTCPNWLAADIGALMRKRKQTLLVPSSGTGGGGGRLDAMAENPVYSPDDSLARAASKLQSLKALRGGPVAPHRPLGVLPAPKAEVNAAPQTTATLPLSSLNPLRAAQRAAPAAPSEQRLG
jgi:hypothetical protein